MISEQNKVADRKMIPLMENLSFEEALERDWPEIETSRGIAKELVIKIGLDWAVSIGEISGDVCARKIMLKNYVYTCKNLKDLLNPEYKEYWKYRRGLRRRK